MKRWRVTYAVMPGADETLTTTMRARDRDHLEERWREEDDGQGWGEIVSAEEIPPAPPGPVDVSYETAMGFTHKFSGVIRVF